MGQCYILFIWEAPPLKPHKTSAAPNVLAQIGIAESQGILQNMHHKYDKISIAIGIGMIVLGGFGIYWSF